MKSLYIKLSVWALAFALMGCASSPSHHGSEPALRDAFTGKFLIGAAVNEWQADGTDSLGAEVVRRHYNTIVAENAMKSESLAPRRGVWDFGKADQFVDFGERNGMFVVGHCLVWHSQLAPWLVTDDEGRYVTADTLRQRMRDYIHTVVGRYKGRVGGWDVVNEAVEDDGSYRRTPFYEILGEEYIPLAFEYAHEADPDAQLYINDYSMSQPARRDRYVQIVNDLKERGLRVDAIGMQAHVGMDYPDFSEFEKSLEAFASTGCNVMLTEVDMTVLPTVWQGAEVSRSAEFSDALNPYPDGLPAEVDSVWNERMATLMDICLRHADVVSRVNFWGVSDGDSWRNDWPIHGRKDYPLPFDREHRMKPFLVELQQTLSAD